MYDYRNLLLQIAPITDVDLMFLNISPETRVNAAKQYNRALINAQGEGTDVAQIFLKPLIVNYPDWGDPALVFGLCLAREYEFKRAGESVEYSIKKILTTQNNLYVAQESLKQIKDSIGRGDKKPVPVVNSSKNGSGKNGGSRDGMQAPILMRAQHGSEDFKMASDRERREVMMRSAASGDEQINDDIEIESMRTPADKMRTTINIAIIAIAVLAIGLIIYFAAIPAAAKLKSADANQERLDFLVSELGEYKDDPEVASILNKYVDKFADEDDNTVNATTADSTADVTMTTVENTSVVETTTAETTSLTIAPEEVETTVSEETANPEETVVPEETVAPEETASEG